jgi:hypothetical protein
LRKLLNKLIGARLEIPRIEESKAEGRLCHCGTSEQEFQSKDRSLWEALNEEVDWLERFAARYLDAARAESSEALQIEYMASANLFTARAQKLRLVLNAAM